ncbi:hypothetical protein DQQ10_26830 [Pseudochryseolinea flava]|uniref:Outer membrane protein beta-barrel domain-containing protein n=2 Tax=Pseudochryseolinea flava TaxID=2059302 RepID=A0A364XWK9_9BACT|nr:hypothetical protein DQQ10_26830 [Pseudochryseolinea flava]
MDVISTLLLLQVIASAAYGQQVDLNNVKKNFTEKPFRMGGGISANTIFYDGNDGQGRQPFTYFLNGNVNFNLFNQINLPFSFSLTNLGADYGYPTLPNRLSVHPMYKSITGHIGDVAMSFSPYTLNGHMFRGVGVDVAPKGPWKFSAMYGRLQRASEFDSARTLVPAAYQRMGYGAKVRYDQSGYYAGMNFFTAKDDPNSLKFHPDSLNIFPQHNVAFGWEGGVKLIDNLMLSGEFGLSLLTRDIRSNRESDSWLDDVFVNRTSTHAYKAYKVNLNYQLFKNTIGLGYERIDPEYRTLGAYYFNNDYENITVNYARPFLQDKITIALSWGIQRDDLNNDKEQSSKRLVSSANINYTPNENFNAALSYSGFQTYMNIRSQFDYINGQTPYDNLDTLDFTQLSQNLALTTLYSFGKNENRRHSLNTNLSYQEAADKQGDVIRPGALSQFYNFSTQYTLLFVPQAVSVHASINATYNLVGGEEFIIVGPTAGAKARIFQKKLTTGLSCSYNVSYQASERQGKVVNVRWNAGYAVAKKHMLMANTVWQQRDLKTRSNAQSITATVGYSYSF